MITQLESARSRRESNSSSRYPSVRRLNPLLPLSYRMRWEAVRGRIGIQSGHLPDSGRHGIRTPLAILTTGVSPVFIPSGGEVGPGERSFNLGESELTLSANVDSVLCGEDDRCNFRRGRYRGRGGLLSHAVAAERFHGERRTVLLGASVISTKCMRMHGTSPISRSCTRRSSAGQHNQDGLQVKWLAPTDLFIELGAETGNGDAFPGRVSIATA